MRALWFFAALLMPALASAQEAPAPGAHERVVPCMAAPAFAELLFAQYGERPVVDGADGRGMPVRWFANPQSGTWTMAVYPRPEVACHALDGKSFRPSSASPDELTH
jgi:hypothetical protein